jgi:hypothetical protein
MRHALVALCVLITAGCSRSGRPIEYVVPDGYKGRLWVLFDPAASELPVIDGRYQVLFPPDGLLRVGSMRPFERWHESKARYVSGSPLQHNLIRGQSPIAPGAVAMWSLARSQTFPDKRDYIVWVVGTESDAKDVGLEQHAPPVTR